MRLSQCKNVTFGWQNAKTSGRVAVLFAEREMALYFRRTQQKKTLCGSTIS